MQPDLQETIYIHKNWYLIIIRYEKKEKEIYRDQALQSGKPENIVEKMIEGRLNKFYQENVLLEQNFVKDPDKVISDLLSDTISTLGENIEIKKLENLIN